MPWQKEEIMKQKKAATRPIKKTDKLEDKGAEIPIEKQEERTVPNVCFGFEVHQPFRLNRHFSPDQKVKKKDLPALYFDEMNQELSLIHI